MGCSAFVAWPARARRSCSRSRRAEQQFSTRQLRCGYGCSGPDDHSAHLRDTAASLAIQAGASVVAVARLLGHEWAARHAGQFGGASGRRCGVPRLSMGLCVESGSGWRCQRRTRRSPVGEVARIDRRGAPAHGTLGRWRARWWWLARRRPEQRYGDRRQSGNLHDGRADLRRRGRDWAAAIRFVNRLALDRRWWRRGRYAVAGVDRDDRAQESSDRSAWSPPPHHRVRNCSSMSSGRPPESPHL